MSRKYTDDHSLQDLGGDAKKSLLTGVNLVPDNELRPTPEYLPEPDPRLVALVRFLARRAAERDYKHILEEARRALRPVGE